MTEELETRGEQAMRVLAGFRCWDCDIPLPADGQCPECEYAHCPYCGEPWHNECEHLIAVDGDEGWGHSPWAQPFVVPDGIDWDAALASGELEEYNFDWGYVAERCDDGGCELEYHEESQLPLFYDVSVFNDCQSPGADAWNTYWAADPVATARQFAGVAARLQAMLDSLPERFPFADEEVEDE